MIEKDTITIIQIFIVYIGIFLGVWLCCYLLEYFQSSKKAYFAISTFFCVSLIISDVVDRDYPFGHGPNAVKEEFPKNYTVAIFAISSGALTHWAQKLGGMTTMYVSASLHKAFESAYKLSHNIRQGGVKNRGDLIYIICIFLAFLGGSTVASVILEYIAYWTLTPLACLLPFHYIFGNIFTWKANSWKLEFASDYPR